MQSPQVEANMDCILQAREIVSALNPLNQAFNLLPSPHPR